MKVPCFILKTRVPSGGCSGHVTAPEPFLAGRPDPEPWDTWRCRSPPQQGGRVWDRRTRGSTGAFLSREVGSRAAGHVAAPEPSSAGRPGPGLWDTWRRRSLPQQGGRVRGRRTRGRAGAFLSREAASGAVGHVAASEPSSAGRSGPGP
jgi:hypothetical protein